jgi:ribosomal protein L20A (L18A)
LVENTLETLGFRERLKFSKIKILNAKLFQKRAEIDKIQIRLKDQESIITRLAETVKRNSLIA